VALTRVLEEVVDHMGVGLGWVGTLEGAMDLTEAAEDDLVVYTPF